jgi:hypothetical protein
LLALLEKEDSLASKILNELGIDVGEVYRLFLFSSLKDSLTLELAMIILKEGLVGY